MSPQMVFPKEYHSTSKVGIHTVAMQSSLTEFIHPTFMRLRPHLEVVGGPFIRAMFRNLDAQFKQSSNFDDALKLIPKSLLSDKSIMSWRRKFSSLLTLRRLATVTAPGGKTRVIAIFDYFTQTCFRPFHLYLIDRLGIWFKGCDMTKDQMAFKDRFSKLKGPFFSFDQSAATDRFPIEYQFAIIEKQMGSEYANSWRYLMVGEEFYCPWLNKYVSYEAGQPMGAYTSWAMFALCHHLVVRVAGYYVYKHFRFNDYVLLGDDIVIADERVANVYYRLMTVNLGVSINKAKSVQSADSFEFAKRIFIQGTDCSPLTWTQQFRVNNPLTVLALFLADCVERSVSGFQLSIALVRKFVTILNGKKFKSSYSVQGSLLLQAVIILDSRNIPTYQYQRDLAYLGQKDDGCGSIREALRDSIGFWVLSQVHKLQLALPDRLSEMRILFQGVVPHLIVHPDLFPHLWEANRLGMSTKDLLVLQTLSPMYQSGWSERMEEYIRFLQKTKGSYHIGELNFARRVDTVREIMSHGCRKYKIYNRAVDMFLNIEVPADVIPGDMPSGFVSDDGSTRYSQEARHASSKRAADLLW